MSDDYDLPDGWEMCSVEQLAQPNGIAYGVLKPGPQTPDGVAMLRVSDVRDGRVDASALYMISPELDTEFRRTKLNGGEVVVSIQGSVGRVAVVPSQLAGANVSRTLAMIRLRDPSLAQWLHRALEAPDTQAAMRRAVGGTTRDSLNLRDLRNIAVPVPPARVRTELLALIEAASSRITSSTTHLAGARRVVERFRQAILAAACSGRLTADWRELNVPTDNADELLASVQNARRERFGRRFKPQSPPTVDAELPEGWTWTTVGALVDVATGATPLRKRADYYGGSIPWVKSGAVNAGLITEASEFITDLAIRETNAKVFPAGTLLVAMYGEGQTRGRVAELGIRAATNQAVAALLFDDSNERLHDYLRIFFLENYERIRLLSFGGVQPNLSLGVIRDTLIPLPPIVEQVEIVRRVDQLSKLATSLRSRIETASKRVDRSSQAVLSKAFRGELVTSAVEPAS